MDEEGRGNWLRVWLDGEPTDFVAMGMPGGWSLHAVEGSESSFDWPTLDRILEWLESSPQRYAFQAFPSGRQDEGERVLSVVALGILQEGMFFGYQGFESFWGGAMSRWDVDRIFAHLKAERERLGT